MHNRNLVVDLISQLQDAYQAEGVEKSDVQQIVTQLQFASFQDASFEDVERRYSNLHEKFVISAQNHKATLLNASYQKLLEEGLSKDSALQSILVLLLELSISPVNTPDIPASVLATSQKKVVVPPTQFIDLEPDESVVGESEWLKDFDVYSDSELEEWSDLETGSIGEHTSVDSPTSFDSDSESSGSENPISEEVFSESRWHDGSVSLAACEIHAVTVSNNPLKKLIEESSSCIHLRNPLCASNLRSVQVENGMTMEVSVLRQIILELHGHCTGVFSSKMNLVHLSMKTLRTFLLPYQVFSSHLQYLRDFQTKNFSDDQDSLTVQALQNAILELLYQLQLELTTMETALTNGTAEVTTLLGLERLLRPTLSAYAKVALFVKLTVQHQQSSTRVFVGQLLSKLHEQACEEALLARNQDSNKLVFAKLHCATVQPYLKMIHGWIQTGKLGDPYGEFFITEKDTFEASGAYAVEVDAVPNFLVDRASVIFRSGTLHNVLVQHNGQEQKTPVLQVSSSPSRKGSGPSRIINTTEASGELALGSLHPHFISFVPLKNTSQQRWESNSAQHEIENTMLRAVSTRLQRSYHSEMQDEMDDQHSIQEILDFATTEESKRNQKLLKLLLQESNFMQHLELIRDVFFLLHHDVLDVLLLPIFKALDLGDTKLVSIVGEEYAHHLLPTESCAVVCQEDQASLRLALNGQLTDSLLLAISTDANARGFPEVNVTFDPPKTSESDIEALDSLKLFLKLESPLDMVVSTASLAQYQRVFNFLIKVKRSQSSLLSLHHKLRHGFSIEEMERNSSSQPRDAVVIGQVPLDEEPPELRQVMHKICIFLKHQLHFVSNLHDYLLHRIVHVVWKKFIDQAQTATTLEELRALHQTCLDTVCRCCMLPGTIEAKASPILEAILELLRCSLRFSIRAQQFLRRVKVEGNGTITPRNHAQWNAIKSTHEQFERHTRFFVLSLRRRVLSGDVGSLSGFLLRLDFSSI